MKANVSGVYKIEDVVTGNTYIGSAKDISKRWSTHLSHFRGNCFKYPELQEAWDDGQGKRVKFSVLHRCGVSVLDETEEFWVNYCRGMDCYKVLNKNEIGSKRSVSDTSNMCLAQTGSGNGNARLTEDNVREIKTLLADGVKQKDIADRFGVGQAQISRIKHGLSWDNVEI